jgi:hypothetical protein
MNGLKYNGQVVCNKVAEFPKKDGTIGYRQEVGLTDGSSMTKYSNFLMAPDMAQDVKAGDLVEITVNYCQFDKGTRMITIGGDLVLQHPQAQKKAS